MDVPLAFPETTPDADTVHTAGDAAYHSTEVVVPAVIEEFTVDVVRLESDTEDADATSAALEIVNTKLNGRGNSMVSTARALTIPMGRRADILTVTFPVTGLMLYAELGLIENPMA